MKKIIYSLSALMMACIISFSGVGGSYIQAHATSVGIEPGVWNDDASAWENISHYLEIFAAALGIYVSPNVSTVLWGVDAHNDFYNFMISDGYTEEEAEECVHGGGGHVRDGISVDDSGNVTYSDEVSDLFHGYILDYLETNSGYSLYKTFKASEIGATIFTDKTKYDNFVTTVDNLGFIFYTDFASTQVCFVPTENLYVQYPLSDLSLYTNSSNETSLFYNNFSVKAEVLNEDWTHNNPYIFMCNGSYLNFANQSYSLSDLTLGSTTSYNYLQYIRFGSNGSYINFSGFISSDGRNVKVWHDLDAFKNYDIGHQMYYVTDSFNNYDSTIDNSTTITSQEYAYYNDNSTTIYQTIQNNIDNSGNSDLTEKDVQDIVDNAVQEIKDSIANSGNDDNGGSDSGDSDGGSGVGDLVDGIGKLLDTILSLIGKVMGVVADFTQSILDLFSGFTEFTDGFSNFLSGAFGFIPQEIWNVIQVGLSLMILLAVIKFLRK